MEAFTPNEIQQCCLGILRKFDEYARDNGITYYMAGGTLLGAVRHHGFIPWDDDIDLMVPRPDYERLISEFKDERYSILSCEHDPDYTVPFARMWDRHTRIEYEMFQNVDFGAFIDIFPIDGYPESELINKIHVWRLKWKRLKINISSKNYFSDHEKYKPVKKLLKRFIRKAPNFYCRDMNTYAMSRSFDTSKYVGVTTTTVHIFSERNPKSIFRKTIMLPFENMMLPAPSGWNTYLRHLYGDYTVLPPEEKRISEHEFKIYWRD